MAEVALSEIFLAKIAGWEVVKQARSLAAGGKVLSAEWSPPILKGIVQDGSASYRAGLLIKDAINIDNLCTCRASKSWGTICAHSVAVGIYVLKPPAVAAPAAESSPGVVPSKSALNPSAAQQRRGAVIIQSETGAPLSVCTLFPPNVPEALGRGKIMLYFEGRCSTARAPLNTFISKGACALSHGDAELLARLEALAGGDTPSMISLSLVQLAGLLPFLKESSEVRAGRNQTISFEESLPLRLKASLDRSGEIVLETKATFTPRLVLPDGWVYSENTFQKIELPEALIQILKGPQRVARARIPQFLNQELPILEKKTVVERDFEFQDFQFEFSPPSLRFHLAGGLAQLSGELFAEYGSQRFNLGLPSPAMDWLPDPVNPRRYSTRDALAEGAARERLVRSGFFLDSKGVFKMNGQGPVLAFFARDYEKLRRDWTVSLEERLDRSATANLERIEPRFEISSSGVQWFDMQVSFQSSAGEQFSNADIQRLIRSGQNHTRLKNGKFALIDTGAVEELQEIILDCAPQQREGLYRMSGAQAGFLSSALSGHQSWKVNASPDWRQRAAQQSGEAEIKAPPLGQLDQILRPYQKHGVGWMEFLRTNHFGGILADEMGLGKTLQTLAFIAACVTKQRVEPRLPCLIVCPSSLVFNWAAEAQKFTPELRVLALHGPARQQHFSSIDGQDVVITSYALIRRDAAEYRGRQFDLLVLDEAQHIKNRQTQNAQAVKSIRATQKLVLTGTPMENSVLDLWSIFDFLMPGYLGSAQDFKDRYEIPITRDRDKTSQSRLSRRIRPFLLRRLKREVAADLPGRIEQVAFCELNDSQKQVYQQVLDASRREVLDAVGANGLPKSQMIILNALLRLRQISCDLRLLKIESREKEVQSGKLEMFHELVEEAVDGGHRILVFSQFVTMLELLKEELASSGHAFCYLDGSTRDRGEVVQKFQNDPAIPIFLISLKAGGVGLNLTGADTVIHFDPWWNPAVEDQATGRAHRIGQTRVVTSYKLITRGTVEEKILGLQQRKRELIQATLEGEEQFAEKLSWEEIQSLFE
jgi:superfamily II DNA or RNA helicase